MNNAIYNFREPKNEPVLSYIAGSQERKLLEEELIIQRHKVIDIPLIIGGKEIRTGKSGQVVIPSDHRHVLATPDFRAGTPKFIESQLPSVLTDGSRYYF